MFVSNKLVIEKKGEITLDIEERNKLINSNEFKKNEKNSLEL
jgi:hypothetical protein